jgi:hypothetical protein
MTPTNAAQNGTERGDEFYIGYAASMPPRLARFVWSAVTAIGCGVGALAIVFGAGHRPLSGGAFEFGHPRAFSGTIVEHPYPALRLDGSDEHAASLLLVAPGKHGAESLVGGLNGRHVSLSGTRILRGALTMVEVDPASIVADRMASPLDTTSAESPGAPVTLTGEVVDSKCFMGVMVPGDGKTHKDCAALCLRGGIPPALSVRDRADHSVVILLAGSHGDALGPRLSDFAGEAVEVTGPMERVGGWPVVRVESMSRK